MRLHYFKK